MCPAVCDGYSTAGLKGRSMRAGVSEKHWAGLGIFADERDRADRAGLQGVLVSRIGFRNGGRVIMFQTVRSRTPAVMIRPVGTLRSRGFSLLEILIVVVVLAIIGGLAVPMLSSGEG